MNASVLAKQAVSLADAWSLTSKNIQKGRVEYDAPSAISSHSTQSLHGTLSLTALSFTQVISLQVVGANFRLARAHT